MQQWRDAKSRHPDALVFFRVGDFYEMFNEDAVEGARLLGLTLTARNNGGAADVPLAGVPVRARDEYLARLVRLGRRVAVCEQVEDPALARGIVRREVTETITPGTVLADALLAERRNNWLVALGDAGPGELALGAADLSTGNVWAKRLQASDLASELTAVEAKELLLPESWRDRVPADARDIVSTFRPDWLFDRGAGEETLRRRYAVHTLDSFGLGGDDAALIGVLGALVAYLGEVQPTALAALRPPQLIRTGDSLVLDEMTRRNLELVEPLRAGSGGGGEGTLIGVLDQSVTPMGGRLFRRWLMRPLAEPGAIRARQDAVADLHENASLRRRLRASLENVRDLERLATKAATGRITPREMGALGRSLEALPAVRGLADDVRADMLRDLTGGLDPVEDVRAEIAAALTDEPPATLAEGGVIRSGWDPELDALREVRDGAQSTIARLQAAERERTGIGSLKVGYNRVFGYYIEVTKSNVDRVPPDYERRQTLANAERYSTPELKEWEARILGAEERIAETEAMLFGALRDRVAAAVARLQDAADRVARLDVLAALAFIAERGRYVRPEIHTGYDLDIRGGRHPVVETMMPRETFIPNDVRLDGHARIIILTGPNMAGKSTLLRQVGLIQLLGQLGSFVPATSARLPVCDRIFTRVGASDNLVRGQSTFMVEMQETAAILHGATDRSLVLLDEIGRGTATYDGVSIAWAVTEFLHEALGAKTIFATHYHELTQLADLLPALTNANVAVREAGHDIVFLHQLRPGGANRSYGIEVGRLAGLPPDVIERAREILRDLEGTHSGGGAGLGRSGRHRPGSTPAPDQLSLFRGEEHPLLKRLRETNIDALTPLEALNLLAELAALARGDAERSRA